MSKKVAIAVKIIVGIGLLFGGVALLRSMRRQRAIGASCHIFVSALAAACSGMVSATG